MCVWGPAGNFYFSYDLLKQIRSYLKNVYLVLPDSPLCFACLTQVYCLGGLWGLSRDCIGLTWVSRLVFWEVSLGGLKNFDYIVCLFHLANSLTFKTPGAMPPLPGSLP